MSSKPEKDPRVARRANRADRAHRAHRADRAKAKVAELKKQITEAKAAAELARANWTALQARCDALQGELDAMRARRRGHKFKIVLTHNAIGFGDMNGRRSSSGGPTMSNVTSADLGFTIHTKVFDVSSGELAYEAELEVTGNYYEAGSANFDEHTEKLTVSKPATRETRAAILEQACATNAGKVFDGTFLDGELVFDALFARGETSEEDEESE